jgi:hypothetical protein
MRIRIRILLLIKLVRICDHWPTDPTGIHFAPPRLHLSVHGPSRLHFDALKLLNIEANADPDTAFHLNADPDSSLQKKCGSGSATLDLSLPVRYRYRVPDYRYVILLFSVDANLNSSSAMHLYCVAMGAYKNVSVAFHAPCY